MSLSFDFHGGSCCGIKHIWGLGVTPEAQLGAMDGWHPENDGNKQNIAEWENYGKREYGEEEDGVEYFWDEICDGSKTPGMRWYFPPRPAETYGERLKAYLQWHDEERSGGVIEIVLAADDLCNQVAWTPFIEKLGFKLVTVFRNSNSGNICAVFHRTTSKLPLKEWPRPNPKPKAAKAAPFARR